MNGDDPSAVAHGRHDGIRHRNGCSVRSRPDRADNSLGSGQGGCSAATLASKHREQSRTADHRASTATRSLRAVTLRIVVVCYSLASAVLVAGCASTYTVSIESPTHATLDVSAFPRVLVAGFIEGGTIAVDTNVETVRLLRSYMRSKTSLTVIEAAILPLTEMAAHKEASTGARDLATTGTRTPGAACGLHPKSEKELQTCEYLFADAVLWKRLGEEYQDALIITGSLFFTAFRRGGTLQSTFIFIDGRTGTVIHSQRFRETVSDGSRRYVPALSSYFRLMDVVLPRVVGIVTNQRVRGTRTLLR